MVEKKDFKADFLRVNKKFLNNFLILSTSVLKNFRTYVYVFFVPMIFVVCYTLYAHRTSDEPIKPHNLFLFMMIPTYSIVFLVNITISEWKNSVFLKRIHSAGVSRFEFLLTIWTFTFLLGLLSFLAGVIIISILGATLVGSKDGNASIALTFQLLGYDGWSMILFSVSMNIIICIALGTIISGLIKSVAISQSVTIVLTLFCIVFSDNFLPPSLLALNKWIVYFSYLIPEKHPVWFGMIGTSTLFSSEPAKEVLTNIERVRAQGAVSFGFNLWICCVTSIIYPSLLLLGGYFSFRWNSK
ncbi:ABC transporter permease [Spiroplasma apis]|uniref:ABC transporter ATP-binding protein n=1 Tax=Spiroplasma apis B31 TaxID=1276258 RepID=V5RJX3_SPIAP|nr:hypothetical protein [Spiroplasma apis]AHB36778.1 ABC transporter ATP-binding protein [Spiroplasma apis B31]